MSHGENCTASQTAIKTTYCEAVVKMMSGFFSQWGMKGGVKMKVVVICGRLAFIKTKQKVLLCLHV